MTRGRQRLGFVPWAVLTIGCASDGPVEDQQLGFSVQDSLGVLIAESSAPAWTEETAWQISTEPSLVIGSRDGEEPGTDLGRIMGVTCLGDGRIAVAEGISQEIRVFDPLGRFLFAEGGPGEGPGEFMSLTGIEVIHGDSIVATDWQGSKLVVFGPGGSVGRTVRTPPLVWNGLAGIFVSGILSDASFIVSHSPQTSDLPPGRSNVERQFHLFDPDGNHIGEFARLTAFEANNKGEGLGPVTFGAAGHLHVGPTGVWYGFSNAYSFQHISVGGVDRIIRIPVPQEVTPERLKDYVRDRAAQDMERDMPLSAPPEVRARLEEVRKARLDEMTFADSMPLFGGLVIGRDGHLWVQGYPSAEELLSPGWDWDRSRRVPRWTVFDPEGRWLGEVHMPGETQVHEIGSDYVLGVQRDEFDVPYVVLHRIEKPKDH